MFNGFNLKTEKNSFANWRDDGTTVLDETWPAADRPLDAFINEGVLDGDAIEAQWFTETRAHVFISHSHDDLPEAIALAGFLKQKLGLVAFVDSLIWGDSRELLARIDKQYCWSEERGAYDYEQRNYSTSHVHLMLASSLTAAMDLCECVLFLNTPNSLSITDAKKPELGRVATASPWIYHEMKTSSVLRRQLDDRRPEVKLAVESRTHAMDSAEPLKVGHRVPLDHLGAITQQALFDCANQGVRGFAALDWLYKHHGVAPKQPPRSFKDYFAENRSR